MCVQCRSKGCSIRSLRFGCCCLSTKLFRYCVSASVLFFMLFFIVVGLTHCCHSQIIAVDWRRRRCVKSRAKYSRTKYIYISSCRVFCRESEMLFHAPLHTHTSHQKERENTRVNEWVRDFSVSECALCVCFFPLLFGMLEIEGYTSLVPCYRATVSIQTLLWNIIEQKPFYCLTINKLPNTTLSKNQTKLEIHAPN